eukprot:TRINITY_DN20055_c0_g1_i1.p2 TRINITY_DN20055_c0_g1~~TRINITY_DN20055_c0_g1_i1.p2  ORF type:complete len:118 (-),score=31.21 TRINITY_DN20055_c0_g1_i1:108-461(-)
MVQLVFQKSEHELFQKNYLSRDVYSCKSCNRQTLRCRSCDEAFCRTQNVLSDQLCAKCVGNVLNWDNVGENIEFAKKEGWCSWCFEHVKHDLEEENFVRRSVYSCESCNMRTLPCTL